MIMSAQAPAAPPDEVIHRAIANKVIKGIQCLLSEAETIEILGLQDRPSPAGALRHLIRMKRIAPIRQGRGVLTFRQEEVRRYLAKLQQD
jgi:hypothetical protein